MSPPSDERSGDPARNLTERLDSWKEIAAYFKRDVRTVRRWEAAEGLPVHRHQHKVRGAVHAYTRELDAWWENGEGPGIRRAAAGRTRRHLVWGLAVSALALIVAAASLARSGPAQSTAAGSRSLAPQSPDSTDARAVYNRGRYLMDHRRGWRSFLPVLEDAVARDPSFAPAQAAMAEGYFRAAVQDPASRRMAWERAERAARRALALDDKLPAAHSALGLIHLYRDWNWTLARQETRHAIELDPEDATARAAFAMYARMAGRLDEAIAARRHARDAAPLDAARLFALAMEYEFARRYAEAAETYREALALEPGNVLALKGLADVLQQLDLRAEEEQSMRRVLALRSPRPVAERFDSVSQREGYRAARMWLERHELESARALPTPNLWTLAYRSARLGETGAAWRYLEAAIDQHDPAVLQMRIDPDLDPLRSDPRFERLLRRLGNP